MKKFAISGGKEGFWLRAEKQTGGKGRLGRTWESPKGNLYCSTLVEVRPDDPPPSTLSFVSALAVFDAINAHIPDADTLLKWPNDILVSDAKICGILLERVEQHIVIGIGVNVAVAPSLSDRKSISLLAAGSKPSLTAAEFLDILSDCFSKRVASWRQPGLDHILQQWQSYAHPVGSMLTVSNETGQKITGEFAGLTNAGALRLRKSDGALIELHAGDVEIDHGHAG